MPLDVRLGDNDPELLRSLDGDAFWALAERTDALPTTAAPSPGAFRDAFESLHDRGCEHVVCITISSGLSATYQSASVGASMCEFPVDVVDSMNATMGQGLLVLDALDARDRARDGDALVTYLNEARSRIRTLGTLDTLDNLKRGGRIGSAQAFLGSLLSIKPIVEVRNGTVEGVAKQRTRGRSFAYLAQCVREAGPLERLAVVHARAEDVTEFIALLNGVDTREPLIVSTMGPVIGAHTGIGTIGVAFETLADVIDPSVTARPGIV